MGQTLSYGLTQYDVEEVISYCNGRFNQTEIEVLYKRFRSLDRGRKGFITPDELLNIPEVCINPLHQRLVRIFGNVNFKEFAQLLSFFSGRASRQDKIDFIFKVYDVDGDGLVSPEDLEMILRQLGGSSLSDQDIKSVVDRVFAEAGAPRSGLERSHFEAVLEGSPLNMGITVAP